MFTPFHIAMTRIGVGAFEPFVLAVALRGNLVGQPRLGVVDSLASLRVLIARPVPYPVVVDFFNSKTDPILPARRPDHPAMAMDAHHANAGEEKDRQHLEPRLVVS